MNHQHSESEGPTSSSMAQELPHSIPRSYSTDSVPSPGVETPNSWKPCPWTQDSPATTPPSSESGSRELKLNTGHDGGDKSSTEPQELGEPKNICFLGAGFVGMVLRFFQNAGKIWSDKQLNFRGPYRCGDRLPQPQNHRQRCRFGQC
jgi:hypothetical protein